MNEQAHLIASCPHRCLTFLAGRRLGPTARWRWCSWSQINDKWLSPSSMAAAWSQLLQNGRLAFGRGCQKQGCAMGRSGSLKLPQVTVETRWWSPRADSLAGSRAGAKCYPPHHPRLQRTPEGCQALPSWYLPPLQLLISPSAGF